MFCMGDEARVMMTLLLKNAEPGMHSEAALAGLCERMRAELPELAGAGRCCDPELTRRQRRAWDGVAWGAAGLQYGVAGRKVLGGAGGVFSGESASGGAAGGGGLCGANVGGLRGICMRVWGYFRGCWRGILCG